MIPSAAVDSTWTWRDWLNAVRVRLSIGRMRAMVTPGLYALGQPDANAPVIVTANYKLTFDIVRRALQGLAAWILVLDTKGINVWCAAGKGTFGTDELVRAVTAANLAQIVAHRTLILPQLGAPGVAAHEVPRRCGFHVVYGPVRIHDLPAFLAQGMRATPAMRRVTFGLAERLVVVPVELVHWFKYALALALVVALLSGIRATGYDMAALRSRGLFRALIILLGFFAGGVLTPALLPWLPGRAFAVKGAVTGVALAVILGALSLVHSPAELTATALVLGAMASFMGLQFTGASTFTSLSGVRKETRVALPLQAVALATGVILWTFAT